MKNIFYLLIIVIFISSCSNKNDRGELVGVKGTKFFPDKPSGMVLIPSGSFLMGMADDDIVGLQNAPTSTVSIKAFFMDETEITNGEYRQFVNWVRDSVVRENLARKAIAVLGDKPSEEQLNEEIGKYYPNYTISEENEDDKSGYQKYLDDKKLDITLDAEVSLKSQFTLNWDVDLIWDRDEYDGLEYAQVMEGNLGPIDRKAQLSIHFDKFKNDQIEPFDAGFYLPESEVYNNERVFDVKRILYS